MAKKTIRKQIAPGIVLEITTDTKVFDDVKYHVTHAGARFNARIRPTIGNQLLVKLQTEPGKPSYPLRWASERQRRFVMAKLRREKNLPYRRTHKFVRGWKITHTATVSGGMIVVSNPWDKEIYVTGTQQQPFHADTGWYKSRDLIAAAAIKAEGQAIKLWGDVAPL